MIERPSSWTVADDSIACWLTEIPETIKQSVQRLSVSCLTEADDPLISGRSSLIPLGPEQAHQHQRPVHFRHVIGSSNLKSVAKHIRFVPGPCICTANFKSIVFLRRIQSTRLANFRVLTPALLKFITPSRFTTKNTKGTKQGIECMEDYREIFETQKEFVQPSLPLSYQFKYPSACR